MKKSSFSLPVVVLTMLLSGCVTEIVDGPPKRKVDNVKYTKDLIDLGIGYLKNGDYPRSKEKLKLALEQDPDSPVVHTTLGLLYQLLGENQLAKKHFRKAIKYDSDNSQARMNYGAFLFQQKEYKEAAKQISRASEDTSYRARAQAMENLGVCYLQLNNSKLAEETFLRSLGLNSNLKRATLEMADIRFNQLRYSEAKGYFRKHLVVSEQSARSLWIGIRLGRIFDKDDEVASYALLLKNIFPESKEYRKYKRSLK